MKIVRHTELKNKILSHIQKLKDAPHPVLESVRKILSDVKRNGDKALLRYIRRFDGWKPYSINEIYLDIQQIKKIKVDLSSREKKALEVAGRRIERFHKKILPKSINIEEKGIMTAFIWTPLERVGIYVPGGKAFYPSTLLMTAIPAKVAGVKEVYCATPGSPSETHPALIYSALASEIDGIFFMGGAHAIGAFAYGTETVPRVDKIVGPGNIYVAVAKKEIMGEVGIDSVAGPTEVTVIADGSVNPKFVASDLLSQAEHDEMAVPVLITNNEAYAKEVLKELRILLHNTPRRKIAEKSIKKNGLCILANNINEAISIAQNLAPEHLILALKRAEKYAKKCTKAGTVFLGGYTPESIGDYIAGPNHTLPTGGRARFQSTLSTFDFLRAYNMVKCSKTGLKRLGHYAVQMAEMEGLFAHAEAIKVRKYEGRKSGKKNKRS